MTRTVSWEEWMTERRRTAATIAGAAERLSDAKILRTRKAEERRALRRAAIDTIRKAEESGRVVWLDARHAKIPRPR